MLRYFDASIVIDGTDPQSPLFSKVSGAIQLLGPAERCVSELVRLDCSVRPVRVGDAARIALLESYLSNLVDLPLDRAVYDLAIDLRAPHRGLRTPDALHLAAALRHGCTEFWTNDRDLAKRSAGLTFRTF